MTVRASERSRRRGARGRRAKEPFAQQVQEFRVNRRVPPLTARLAPRRARKRASACPSARPAHSAGRLAHQTRIPKGLRKTTLVGAIFELLV